MAFLALMIYRINLIICFDDNYTFYLSKLIHAPNCFLRFFDSENLRDPHTIRMLELFSDQKLFHSTAELAQAVQTYLEFLSSALSSSSIDEKKKLDIQETDIKDICRFCIFYLEVMHFLCI